MARCAQGSNGEYARAEKQIGEIIDCEKWCPISRPGISYFDHVVERARHRVWTETKRFGAFLQEAERRNKRQ